MGLEAKLINTVNNYSRTNSKAIIDEFLELNLDV